MKTLVTHLNPHLDEVVAIWLLRKFDAEFKDSPCEFIHMSKTAEAETNDPNKVFIGTGGGRFDEHKGDLDDCATTLVWKYLLSEGYIPEDRVLRGALSEITEWSLLIDLGRGPQSEFGPFAMQTYIRPKDYSPESSNKALDLGGEILDRILEVLKKKQQSIVDWEKRVEFECSYGKGVAVQSTTVDRPFCKSHPGDLFIMVDPQTSGVQYFTPSYDLDLEPIYNELLKVDKGTNWYLHQGHHMILSGRDADHNIIKPTLTFDGLMDVAKRVKAIKMLDQVKVPA